MSAIPPTWLGSIIQTQGAQKRAAEAQDAEKAAQAERAGAGSFADSLQDVIEASDRDSQVYADAEGAGSRGRPSEEPADEEHAKPGSDDRNDQSGGLDIEA